MSLLKFLGSLEDGARAEAALIGVPYDSTSSYRSGARFGPNAIREASHSLESYSAFLDRDLANRDYVDLGDVNVGPRNPGEVIEIVHREVSNIINKGLKPIILGGEHTITVGAFRAMLEKYPNLNVLQIDAHADFRDEYYGEKFSHATVMKRIAELIPSDRIHRLGIRSGSKEELLEAGIFLPIDSEEKCKRIPEVIQGISENAPLYLTLDLDVFDPSLIPGVGNPEPMGITFREFIQITRGLAYHKIVGCDIVELAPQYDSAGVSSIVAASVVRDLLLIMLL